LLTYCFVVRVVWIVCWIEVRWGSTLTLLLITKAREIASVCCWEALFFLVFLRDVLIISKLLESITCIIFFVRSAINNRISSSELIGVLARSKHDNERQQQREADYEHNHDLLRSSLDRGEVSVLPNNVRGLRGFLQFEMVLFFQVFVVGLEPDAEMLEVLVLFQKS